MHCEIEFLPIGDGSKAGDAIVVRYGSDQHCELMVIDGGKKESGERVVSHNRTNTLSQDRYRAALTGIHNLLGLLRIS